MRSASVTFSFSASIKIPMIEVEICGKRIAKVKTLFELHDRQMHFIIPNYLHTNISQYFYTIHWGPVKSQFHQNITKTHPEMKATSPHVARLEGHGNEHRSDIQLNNANRVCLFSEATPYDSSFGKTVVTTTIIILPTLAVGAIRESWILLTA